MVIIDTNVSKISQNMELFILLYFIGRKTTTDFGE